MKSKKIKKIIIYTLVAMIVSTSVFFSYEKASRVKAAVVVDDAIIIATLLGAMGIVYIGSEWYGSNLAEDWYPDYGEELGEVEDNIINLWDTEVWQLHDQGVITNPPDDFDPDNDDPEENPPTWEKLKQWMRAHPEVSLAIGTTTLLGGIFAKVSSQFEDKVNNGLYFNGLITSEQFESFKNVLVDYPYTCIAKHRAWNDGCYYICMFKEPIALYIGKYWSGSTRYDGYLSTMQSQYKRWSYDSPNSFYTGTLGSGNCLFGMPDWTIVGGSVPIYDSIDSVPNNYNQNVITHLDNNTVKYSSNPRGDEYGNIILPHEEIAPVGQVQLAPLLDALYNANQATDAEQAEQLKQQATDNFISSLENPEPNPEPNPNPNPDEGEDSGSTDMENNSSFLADLSHLFPFCIPFDLINCVKLLTAERETPCVEVPMHFKFVDVDYTWVIDLEDFNGVASVCRTMFLLLYIVGLVMVTRPLIRG